MSHSIYSSHELNLRKADIAIMTRQQCIDGYRALLDEVSREKRELNGFEQAACDAFQARIDVCNKQPAPARGYDQRLPEGGNGRTSAPSSFAYFDGQANKWIRDVGHGESLAQQIGVDSDAPSIGGIIKGALTGKWHGLEREAAAIQTSQTASGGILVGSATSAQLIDRARAMMVMNAAGMRTISIPDGVNELAIGRVTGDPTCTWRVEGGAIPSSTPTFDAIYLRPKTLGCLVPVSVEFLEDCVNAEALIENILVQSMARALDEAVLRGSGSPGPTGIRYTTDVETTAVNAAWTYDTLLDGMKTIWDNNGPAKPTAVILSTASELSRQKRKDGDGQYLTAHPLADVPFLVTTAVPDNLGAGAASELYTGDFSRVLLAMKTSMKIEILPAGTADSINAVSQLMRWFRIYLRADCHIEQPGHLWYGSGVLN